MPPSKIQQPDNQASPGLPDYLADPNAVLGDTEVQWRYGRAPDYSKTRGVWAQTKKANHAAGSLPELVENLVKNWEIEASFKTKLADWRTVDHKKYSFAINGGPPQSGEHMLKVGTYNAIIAPNEYYSPENSDFASSHKTFKRMMPTFAWEVVEVYSGPPRVAFKWRHWGTMKNDYVGFNDKGEKVTAKAHGGVIDILGVTIATVDEKVRLQAVDTYFDPLDMFRQIAPSGIVNKQVVNRKVFTADKAAALDEWTIPANDGIKIGQEHNGDATEHIEENLQCSSSDVFHDATTEAPVPSTVPERGSGSGLPTRSHAASQGSGTRPETEKTSENNEGCATKEAVSGEDEATGNVAGPLCSSAGDTNTVKATCPITRRSREPSPSSSSGPENMSTPASEAEAPYSLYSSGVTGDIRERVKFSQAGKQTDYSKLSGVHDEVDRYLERPTEALHPHPKTMEETVKPRAGEAVVVGAEMHETIMTHEEMSRISPSECPFLMNRE